MENQHCKINGYRELTHEEIAAINEVKSLSFQVNALVKKIRNRPEYAVCLDLLPDLTYPFLKHFKNG